MNQFLETEDGGFVNLAHVVTITPRGRDGDRVLYSVTTSTGDRIRLSRYGSGRIDQLDEVPACVRRPHRDGKGVLRGHWHLTRAGRQYVDAAAQGSRECAQS